MTIRDGVELAMGNLWRVKLRAFLTITGVTIAIATFISMLSFGAGNVRHVTKLYTDLGLFTSMKVYPEEDSDSVNAAPLDADAISRLSKIPGVILAFPFVTMNVSAQTADTLVHTTARALPPEAFQTKLFTTLLDSTSFESDTAREAIVTHEFAEMLGIDSPSTLLGRPLIVSVRVASLDSALINVIDNGDGIIWKRLDSISFDSLFEADYRSRIMRRELNEGVRRFVTGFTSRTMTVSDTLTITGIAANLEEYRSRLAPIIVPEKTARRLTSSGYVAGSDPLTLLSAAQRGSLFSGESGRDAEQYPQVTLEVDPLTPHGQIKDSVEALGYRAFSYAEQFKEFQRFQVYFFAGLAVVGLIALATASLGIVNTMVMSISERRREIGIVKALGADELEIRWLFLVESGVIGALGSIAGIFSGWVATRIVSLIIQAVMRRQEMPVFDPFDTPFWLVILAFAFGVGVSLAAGLYPAARAARVDPVEALRSE